MGVGVVTNNLGLVGDGDELDLLAAVESSFDIKFVGDELSTVVTVGDLYELVLLKLPNTEPGARQICRSANAFRKIRRASRLMALGEAKPETRIAELIGPLSPRRVFRELELTTGLSLNALVGMSPLVFVSCLLLAASVSVWYFVLPSPFPSVHFLVGLILAAAVTPAVTLILLVPTYLVLGDRGSKVDNEVVTVGDLASRATHLNFARLGGAQNQNHPQDVWRTLIWLAKQYSDCSGDVDRDTKIIADWR